MEVMKAGYLRKNISTNTYKKQYKVFYFVLKRDRENSSKKTLVYFKDENSCVKNQPEGVCNLYSQCNVDIKLTQKKKFIFEIVNEGKSFELMATDETSAEEWVKLLTEGLVIQIFSVIKMSYPPTAQKYVKDMKGTVLLKIDESSVTLLSNNGPAIYWEFSVIRKYKMNNGLLILEVGKKSITGEGEFYFDTSDPKRLLHVLDKAVKERVKEREIVPSANPTADYPSIKKHLNSHQVNKKYDTNETNKTENVEPNESTYDHLSHVPNYHEKPSTPTPNSKNTYDSLLSSTRMVAQQKLDPQITHILNNTELLSDKTKITSAAVNNHDTNKTDKTETVEPNDRTYDHLSHVPNHLPKPSTPPPSSKDTYDSLFSSTRMVTQQRSDPQTAAILNSTKLLSGKTKITSPTYDHLSHVSNHLAKPSTTPPCSKDTYDSLFSSTRMVTQRRSDPQTALILNSTNLLSGKTKVTSTTVNNHDTNQTNKTENVEPNESTYEHLSHVPNHLPKPSTPPPCSKNTYESLFSSTRMVTQQRSDPQTALILNSTNLLSGKTKVTFPADNNHDTNKTNKTQNVEPNGSTYDQLSHVPNHLVKASTPPPSSKDTYDSLFSSTRMVTQRRFDPQTAPILNSTKLLGGKTKVTSPAVNNHDTNRTDKTENVEPNESTYDHLSHVSNHLVKPSTPPPGSKDTYDSLFSSTRMVIQRRFDPQTAPILNNTKLLSGKTKITSPAVNNHDTNRTDKTENVEPNESTYDHLSHVPNHLVKPSTPTSSSKDTYDSLFSSARTVAQQKFDPQITHISNNTKLLNDETKITSPAVNNCDTNKTDKAENVEPNDPTYDHLSHVPNHLVKPSTPPLSSKDTYDSLFPSARMITQRKSDPQIVPFLNNAKLLSCKTVASSAVMPPVTPTVLENMQEQMHLCQTSEIKTPIPLSLRSRPATALRSMELLLNSEMYHNEKLPVGKLINPTLRPKEESTGVLNNKNTSTSNNDICDNSNNMYEVVKEPCQLSNDNIKENHNNLPNEHNHLPEHPPKEAPKKLPEYKHLKRNFPPKPLARTNKFGLQESLLPPFKSNKKPLRPSRSPPLTLPLQKQQQIFEIPRTIMNALDSRNPSYN